MNKAEILKRITDWQTAQKALTAKLDALTAIIDCQYDSPLLESMRAVADAHTKAVAELVGDTGGWLEWWELECWMGDKPMSASKSGGKFRKVTNLKILAGLISE